MNKPFIIGICGGSGSGKTTFVRQLRSTFSPEDVAIVSQDDYYFPREMQETDENGVHNFDLPKSIDKKRMLSDLARLISGEPIEFKEYTFNNADAAPNIRVVKPAKVLIVEGLFIFHYRKIAAMLNLRIFVSAKDPHKIARRILRDQNERNYPLEDVIYRYQAHVLPAYERYIEPYKEGSDLVINNNSNFDAAFGVVRSFIEMKIMEKK